MVGTFDPKELRFHLKWTVPMTVLSFMALFIDNIGAQIIALIFFACAGFQTLFYGTTLYALSLDGPKLRYYQLAIAIAYPALLTAYFVYDAKGFDAPYLASKFANVYFLIAFAFFFYIGKIGSEQLDKTYWFRGYMIAATAMFVICMMGASGVYFDSDDGESRHAMQDDKVRKLAAQTGQFAIQYPLYVICVYAGMIFGQRRRS